jgi:hypothetical protein
MVVPSRLVWCKKQDTKYLAKAIVIISRVKRTASAWHGLLYFFVPCVSRSEDWIRAIYWPLTWRNVGPGWRIGITNLKSYSTGKVSFM